MVESKVLNINSKDELIYISFPALDKIDFILHGFSTRKGGVSKGIYESMNLATGRDDDYENVVANFNLFCDAIGIDYKDLVFSYQTHDTNIRIVDENDKGKGIIRQRDYSNVDGLVTNIPNVPLLTSYADCVPLFFVDPVQKAIGLAHSGWKGTVKKIGGKMIDAFTLNYNSDPKDIIVCIGPSIGPCCFEVSEDVYINFKKMDLDISMYIKEKAKNKYDIDLWSINKDILIESGVNEGNITVTDLCTKCNPDLFFSHRATKGQRGALAAVMQISIRKCGEIK